MAALGRLDIYAKAQRPDDLSREAGALLTSLENGRWRLTKAQYVTYRKYAREALGNPPPDNTAAVVRSEVVADLWQQRGTEHPITRGVVSKPSGTVLVIWSSTPSKLDAVIAGQSYLETMVRAGVGDLRWATSHEGRPIVGAAPVTGPAAVRAAVTSGLPCVSFLPIVRHTLPGTGGQMFSPEWGPPVFGR